MVPRAARAGSMGRKGKTQVSNEFSKSGNSLKQMPI